MKTAKAESRRLSELVFLGLCGLYSLSMGIGALKCAFRPEGLGAGGAPVTMDYEGLALYGYLAMVLAGLGAVFGYVWSNRPGRIVMASFALLLCTGVSGICAAVPAAPDSGFHPLWPILAVAVAVITLLVKLRRDALLPQGSASKGAS